MRNVPVQCTTRQLEDFLREPLRQLSIFTFDCQKMKTKGCAILTIADKSQAERFLQQYGAPPKTRRGYVPGPQLIFLRHTMICAPSKSEPDELSLRSLKMKEAKSSKKSGTVPSSVPTHSRDDQRTFGISGLACGMWAYPRKDLEYVQYFHDPRQGSVVFGPASIIILLYDRGAWQCRLDIPHYSINNFILGTYSNPTVSLSLNMAPRIYTPPELDALLAGLSFGAAQPTRRQPPRTRVCGIDHAHEQIAGSCLAYRVLLSDRFSLEKIHQLIKRDNKMPPIIPWPVPKRNSAGTYAQHIAQLHRTLGESTDIPWTVSFQVVRLATDSILIPAAVFQLIPSVRRILEEYGPIVAAEAVRRLARNLPAPAPDVEASNFDLKSLEAYMEKKAASFRMTGSMYDLAERYEHICLVHKVTITPTATYLTGPEPEVKNRVLRRFPNHGDCFIRVTFCDEDGEAIRFDPQASLEKIFHERFKQVLDNSIDIAGRSYTFLGFSHSSLRSQTCWFMAPFVQDRALFHARQVVQGLGDFSKIRSPARCAARIGQSFSDATCTVPVQKFAVRRINDVERNGRCFSDGCGTLSQELLREVWLRYALRKDLKPTLLQIRFAGAKGMLSLDTRLEGERICLRPSMLKFEGANAWDIEICGSALKPLPMFLNRQFIKILEDLGVGPQIFLTLQAAEVERLRRVTLSPVNAASFLEHNFVGTAAKMPDLIRMLDDIGLLFQEDPFLEYLVELAALTSLRELKYRARIPVQQAFTLYGIMDETNYLKEGEVYVVVEKTSTSGREVLENGRVIVTRAPAMFPGDVQYVRAVNVPSDSPLNALSNCVVFSSKGPRDLPSCLSGGDLDGDLYNVSSVCYFLELS